MLTSIDSEWYWLERIHALLAHRLGTDVLTDWIVPVANLILAAAAVSAAIMSWRTSHAANELTATHWAKERAAQELRWRRTLAVDVRDWYSEKWFNALLDRPDGNELSDEYRRLIRKCDRAGEADGKRLLRFLMARAWEERARWKKATLKERASARHPSRSKFAHLEEDQLIDAWVEDPASIRANLDKHDALAKEEQRAFIQAAMDAAGKAD